MLNMGRSYERSGKPELPVWWTSVAWKRLDEDGRSYSEIAREASRIAGRESPWGGTAISKLKDGSAVTRELANALSDVLELPRPYFDARSEAEARAMMAAQNLHDSLSSTGSAPNPDTISRRSRVASALESAVEDARSQKRDVVWRDEGSPRSPGSRRAPARRKSTARS